jgi:hypothetical protein
MADHAETGRLVSEVAIQYTVRELLARIEDRQIRNDERMSNLATKAEVEAIATKVAHHEARWNRLIGAALAISALFGGVAGYVASIISAH